MPSPIHFSPRTKNLPAPHDLERICVSVAGSSPEDLLERSASLLPEFPFQELRLDLVPDLVPDLLPEPHAFLSQLALHTSTHPQAVFLATCRRQGNGGHFTGTATEELEVLLEAIRAGCRWVDLSLESAEDLSSGSLASLRAAGAKVILSWHDFERTGDLRAVLERMRPYAPDLFKIVPTARSFRDNLAPLALLATERELGNTSIVALAMGAAGVPSRILGVGAGSVFTFAAPGCGATTAPGQIDARTLRESYRLDEIGAETRVYGVAGDPIASSLSPTMQNAAFRSASVYAVYLPLLTKDADELFAIARALPLHGFSVTMPLKQAVLPFLNYVDPLALKIGAVNTVRREADGSFSGFNTDVAGVVDPLEARLSLPRARVLVLGAGGAARAAVFGCVDRGAHVFILNRQHEKAIALANESGAIALRPEDLPRLPAFDAILNATPVGMRGHATELPLAPEDLRCQLVFDMVYNPGETPFLQAARARGLQVIPGIEMFVRQGALQFQLWTGQPAPVEAMRAAALGELAKLEGKTISERPRG